MGLSCDTQEARGVGILVDKELRKQVVEIKRVNDRVIAITNKTSIRINMVQHEALISLNAEKTNNYKTPDPYIML